MKSYVMTSFLFCRLSFVLGILTSDERLVIKGDFFVVVVVVFVCFFNNLQNNA